MNRKEFIALMTGNGNLGRDYRLFYELADTPDLGEYIVYHNCNFCNYTTRMAYCGILDGIDMEIAEHLWRKHRSISVKKAMAWVSTQIGNVAGQAKN